MKIAEINLNDDNFYFFKEKMKIAEIYLIDENFYFF